ncbi:hypothetical protein J3459_013958 [Metarhizium acridum]|nr:hypothetical protein J3459_013958 [Metarhizium acridum]
MDIGGLALGVYKDAYFLSKSVYRLITSAQYYKDEQKDVIQEFYHEFLRLRAFHHVIFTLRGKEIAKDSHNVEVLKEVCDTIKRLGEALSEYKNLAIKHDQQYRKYNIASQPAAGPLFLEFPMDLDDLLPPSDLDTPRLKRSGFKLCLGGLKGIFKSPVFTTEAWVWVLFERDRLQQAVADFRRCNLDLADFGPILLWSTVLTRQDVQDIVRDAAQESGLAGRNVQSFLSHIRLREIAEHPDPAVYDGNTLDLSPFPNAKQTVASTSISAATGDNPGTLIEYKRYSPASSYISNPFEESTQGSASETGGETQRGNSLIAQAHQLARLLFEAGSHEFHTLPFRGYLNDTSNSRFAFYFDYPQGASEKQPATLRHLIGDNNDAARLLLPQRFQIALTVSRALGAFHADGWVHKSVRSHSVMFFYNHENRGMYDQPYLVDFEFSRPEMGGTQLVFDDDLERNLYRHPDRLGYPMVEFNKVHDVYGLGVVLLELGLWQTARSIYDITLERWGEDSVRSATRMQDIYLARAKGGLGHVMGPAYSDAVVACLSGELGEFLGKDDFAFMFRKKVVEKVDPRQLLDYP